MIFDQRSAFVYQIDKKFSILSFRQNAFDAFSYHIMRRLRRRTVKIESLDHKQMPVSDSGIERYLFIAERSVQRFDKNFSFFAGDMSRTVIGHGFVLDGHKIAAENPIARRYLDALRGCFDGRSAGIIFVRIVTEYRHHGDITAGL